MGQFVNRAFAAALAAITAVPDVVLADARYPQKTAAPAAHETGVGGHGGTAAEGRQGPPVDNYPIANGKRAKLKTCRWNTRIYTTETRDQDGAYQICVIENAKKVGGIDKLISDKKRRNFYHKLGHH